MKQLSPYLSLQAKDFLKALVILLGFTALSTLMPIISEHRFPNGEEWKGIGFDSLKIVIVYLLKNLFTNSQGEVVKKEPVKTD